MTWLGDLYGIVKNVPAAFWGIIAGSFFSLAGVALTNRASERRLISQFEHERALKVRDRELSLRKEVYLSAVEAIDKGVNTIGRMANFEASDNDLNATYGEKSSAVLKVHLIAEMKTVQVLSSFSAELGAAHVKLLNKRNLLKNQEWAALVRLKENMAMAMNTLVEVEKALAVPSWVAEDGKINDGARYENFNLEKLEEFAAYADHCREDALPLVETINKFHTECILEHHRLQQLFAPVMVALRSELELPIDGEAYQQLRQTWDAKFREATEQIHSDKIAGLAQPFVPGDAAR